MSRKASLIIILCIAFITSNAQNSTTAYCWDAPPTPPTNIVPMCWVGTYADPPKMYQLNDIAGITAQLQSMPVGKRCLFLWDTHLSIKENPNDVLKDSVTLQAQGYTDSLSIFHAYPNIWWDSGAAQTAIVHSTLFQSLAAAGAPLDMVVLDFEYFINNWSLETTVNNYLITVPQRDSVLTDLYMAIMSDSRFPELADSLGFNDLMCVRNWWQNDSCYLIFDDYWQRKRMEYLTTALVNPLLQYYPNARFSNYGDVHRSADFPVPDINGHQWYKYSCTGTHTGTHQSADFYGWLGQICGPRPPEGMAPNSFLFTPYNALLYQTNWMKSTVLSNPTPLIGWIAFPSFQEYSMVTYENSPYFFENIFHLLLSGSDDVLFWNPAAPWGPGPVTHQQEAVQVSNTLAEFDSFWSSSVPDTTLFYPADTITAWNSPYILTGMASDSVTLWRFTPRLDSASGFDQPIDFLTGTSPLTFNVYGDTLTFPSGAIISPVNNISTNGLWIISQSPPTGIQNPVHNNLAVYPNPVHDRLYFSNNKASIDYTIIDIYGRHVRTGKSFDYIPVEDLSSGIYMLIVNDEAEQSAIKFIKN